MLLISGWTISAALSKTNIGPDHAPVEHGRFETENSSFRLYVPAMLCQHVD